MARSGILVALCCLLAFLGAANAATCLAYPRYAKLGENCGFEVYCESGSFCSKAGICVDYIALGQPCDERSSCTYGSQCKGPEGQKICVAYANPGETCDEDSDVVTPTCPYPLSCLDGVCVGGQVGDGCTATSHCSGNLTCVTNICTPLQDGQVCISSNDCKPESFCRDNKCRPKVTEGLCAQNECAYGLYCVGYSNGDTPSCVKPKSREAGEFCNTDELCKGSMRCYNNKCSPKKVSACTSNSQCSSNQICTCGGDYLEEGVGSCSSYSCYSKYNKYDECVTSFCKGGYSSYSKSCANLNCANEWKATLPCDD